MVKPLCVFIAICLSAVVHGQLCPGGGTSFSNAVFFDPGFVVSCSSGTNCSGGQTLDNRAACEPVIALDACAPVPSCGTAASMGSDLWFKFYATGTTATINVLQSVSFIASIQAFSGTPACGNLTQIGCAVAGGPSSGVALNLSGLTAGQLYHFRVFGTASSASQRTGTFCFCGTSGLSATVLPVKISTFTTRSANGINELYWTVENPAEVKNFIVERSTDGGVFAVLARIEGQAGNAGYHFTDSRPVGNTSAYRLTMTDRHDVATYSQQVLVHNENSNTFRAGVTGDGRVWVNVPEAGLLRLTDAAGMTLIARRVVRGHNWLSVNAHGICYASCNGKVVTLYSGH